MGGWRRRRRGGVVGDGREPIGTYKQEGQKKGGKTWWRTGE